MADINLQDLPNALSRPGNGASDTLTREEILSFVELLFFAYRDFISDPDEILEGYGFGRAHHRVIHFVGRNPGIRVAELLEILRITKQSLGRVLRELIETGFVYQREGASDRRRRLLYLTDAGADLMRRLQDPQIVRVAGAIEAAGPDATRIYRAVLMNLIDEDDRDHVRALVAKNGKDAEGV